MTGMPAPAAWQTGLLLGGLAVAASLQPSIYPRTAKQQAITSGGSFALGAAAGTGIAAALNLASRRFGLPAPVVYGAAAAAGLATAVGIDMLTREATGPTGAANSLAITVAGAAGAGLGLL